MGQSWGTTRSQCWTWKTSNCDVCKKKRVRVCLRILMPCLPWKKVTLIAQKKRGKVLPPAKVGVYLKRRRRMWHNAKRECTKMDFFSCCICSGMKYSACMVEFRSLFSRSEDRWLRLSSKEIYGFACQGKRANKFKNYLIDPRGIKIQPPWIEAPHLNSDTP